MKNNPKNYCLSFNGDYQFEFGILSRVREVAQDLANLFDCSVDIGEGSLGAVISTITPKSWA